MEYVTLLESVFGGDYAKWWWTIGAGIGITVAGSVVLAAIKTKR